MEILDPSHTKLVTSLFTFKLHVCQRVLFVRRWCHFCLHVATAIWVVRTKAWPSHNSFPLSLYAFDSVFCKNKIRRQTFVYVSCARRAVEVEIKANARCGSSHYSCAWNDYIETVPLFFSWQALWKFWLYLIFRYLRKSSAEFFHKIVLYVRYLWIFEALAKRFTPFYHREKCNFLLLSQQ